MVRLSGRIERYAAVVINLGEETIYGPTVKFADLGLEGEAWHVTELFWGSWSQGIRRLHFLLVSLRAHQTYVMQLLKAKPGDCEPGEFNSVMRELEPCPPLELPGEAQL